MTSSTFVPREMMNDHLDTIICATSQKIAQFKGKLAEVNPNTDQYYSLLKLISSNQERLAVLQNRKTIWFSRNR